MPAVYPEQIIVEFYNGSAWVDVSAYVVGDITGSGGLGGWKPENRVAVLGSLNLTLNNKAKLFSPMGGDAVRGLNTLSGFTKGAKIRVKVVMYGETKTVWIGRISAIESDDKNWGDERARISAVDWMDVTVNYPMKGASIATNQSIDMAMSLLLARLPVQPDGTSFDVGAFTFDAVFDNVRNKSMAAGELSKLANSELGYIYLKADGTLRVENANARPGNRAVDVIPVDPDNSGRLLLDEVFDTGAYLLLENGFKLILNEAQAPELNTKAEGFNIMMDPAAILNSAMVRAYPTLTDTSLKVLYSLGTPLFLAPARAVTFTAHYTDPNGFAQASGTNMQTPAATTDYTANTKRDGTGTDQTANLAVAAIFFGDSVEFTVTNNAGVGVWVTKLQARGYGIYYGNSIESILNDTSSQNAYGLTSFQFDQRYQKDPYWGAAVGAAAIAEYKDPKSRISKMKYLANLSAKHMLAFLCLGIGALITVTEDRSGISNNYYVTDQAFTIKQGGIINVTYGIKQNDSYSSGALNPVAVEYNYYGGGDAINFGQQPRICNLPQRSFSIWAYMHTTGTYGLISLGSAFYPMYISTDRHINFYQAHKPDPGYSFGIWETSSAAITALQWTLIVVTHDTSLSQLAAPKIYANGTLQALTVDSAPAADIEIERGLELVIGNRHSSDSPYDWAFDGLLYDARIYNRILSQAEITALYNGGTPDRTLVTDGIIFQAPAVSADHGDATSLAGTLLSAAGGTFDNAFRAPATINGTPVIRAIP